MNQKKEQQEILNHAIKKNVAHKHISVPVDERSDEERSKNSLKVILIIISIVIVIIAGIIIIGKYLPNKNPNLVTYNNYEFQRFEGDKWVTQQVIGGQLYNIPFYNNPKQVLDIPVDPKVITAIRIFKANPDGTVYVTADPNEPSKIVLAAVEYVRILGKGYNIYNMNVKSAITSPIENSDIPVMTCNNVSRNNLIIYQKVSDKNMISINKGCIILESISVNESVRVADAFTFRLLHIITENSTNTNNTVKK